MTLCLMCGKGWCCWRRWMCFHGLSSVHLDIAEGQLC